MSSSTGSTISSGGAGASDALSAPLAPGFRFHPTDEELVSYYLRRKILGRPLKVDAIAEVDLYKCDPWDLPSRSRIRSRDGEWYFFSPLDKKYSNGSGKTNRATGRGYWKTTGKDRAVYRRGGGKAVGMKKTLVFHVGKAPKGERTNWVMHEYRIEGEYDEALREAGVSQDSYVVCRIFQKAGPGPQNGAQYGAPYVDEEWRDYDDFDAKVVLPIAPASPPAPNADPAAATALAVVAVPNPADDDFKTLLEEQGADSFNGRVGSVLKVNDDKNGMDKVDSVTMDGEASVLDFHQQQVLDFPIENYPLIEGIGVDDYLELNDFMDPVDMYLSNDQALYPAAGDFEVSPDMFVQRSGLPTTGCENFPYTTEEEVQLMQADPTSEQNFSFDMDDILGFEPSQYLLDGGADDVFLYSNASNQTEAVYGICGKDDANSQYLVTTGSSSSDPFDDIESFLEGPQDEHEYSFPDSADSTSWLHNERLATTKGDIVALQMNQQPSDIGGGNWSPASKIEPPAISQANIEKFDVYARDSKTDSSSKTITKRLWSMLDSISAPPALAAEAPLLVKSLVIDSAAWMKANRLAFEGDGKAAGSKPSKDSASIFEPCFRMHHCATSWMARNGFSVCFSVLLLAASVKIGRCYSRLFFM